MKTIEFLGPHRTGGYGCSEPGNNAGEYVRADVARELLARIKEMTAAVDSGAILLWTEEDLSSVRIAIANAESAEASESLETENKRLKGELVGIGKYAAGHHSDEEPCRWLHALTVDIPAMVEQITGERISEPSGNFFPPDLVDMLTERDEAAA